MIHFKINGYIFMIIYSFIIQCILPKLYYQYLRFLNTGMSLYDLSSRSAKFTGKKNSICLCQLIFFLVTYDVFIEMLKIKCLLIFSGSETKENGQTRPPPPCHHGHNREDTVAAPNTDQKVNTWGSFKTKDHFLELHFR